MSIGQSLDDWARTIGESQVDLRKRVASLEGWRDSGVLGRRIEKLEKKPLFVADTGPSPTYEPTHEAISNAKHWLRQILRDPLDDSFHWKNVSIWAQWALDALEGPS